MKGKTQENFNQLYFYMTAVLFISSYVCVTFEKLSSENKMWLILRLTIKISGVLD